MDADQLYTAEMGNRVEILASSLKPARFSQFTPPLYPSLARQAGIAGQATLVLEVNRGGAIGAIREASSTHPLLAQEAKRAVEKWSFVPDSREQRLSVTVYFGFAGAPVDSHPKARVTVDFAASSIRVYVTSNPAPMVRP